jgi:recombination protein RecA
MTNADKRASALQTKMEGGYGKGSAIIGRQKRRRGNSIPSGSLSLDFTLGTRGWPRGYGTEVFGAASIGKTTIFGYGALRGANSLGLVSAVIAVEPNWDDEWAEKNGVNLDTTVVLYPDTLEEAFGMLRDIVYDNEADFILFDSLGGGTTDKAIESDTKQAYGNSGLITWGVQRVVPRIRKNNITVMYINQVRQYSGGNNSSWHESPGGEALKHAMTVRVHAKPGAKKFNSTVHGDNIMVGREIQAVMKKNKAAQAMGRTAKFNYFYIETDEHPFGIDQADDVVRAAKTAGAIKGATWLNHPAFPNGKIQGAPAAGKFLLENPDALAKVREDTLAVMDAKAAAADDKRTKLKVVES